MQGNCESFWVSVLSAEASIISVCAGKFLFLRSNIMKNLFVIDLHDYEDNYSVYRRPSARGIIINNNKIALVYSTKEKYYKFPGGGIKDDEDMRAALIREVREEVGLNVIPETIKEFGSVLRRQNSDLTPNTIFEQENFYFLCQTDTQMLGQELDDYEKDAGFSLRIVDIDDAIKVNDEYHSSEKFNEIMIKRELRVLMIVKEWLMKEVKQKE